jgi:nitrate/nitrite transporter NarK
MRPQELKESQITSSSNSWQRWVEPWYLVYALQGAVIAGMLPILLPLAVSLAGSAADIGLVMASFSLGGLTAPLWGGLADRYRLHRSLLVFGLLTTAAGLFVFSITTQRVIRIGITLFLGLGAACAATVANLFVVKAHPKFEWDERIGWLHTFYGIGQVGGLLLAGVLSQTDQHIGLLAAAGLSGMAALLGWATTKTPPIPLDPKPVLLHPARHGEWVTSSPQRLFQYLDLTTIRKLLSSLHSPFWLFLIAWLASIAGSAAFFSQYPVLMQKVFGIPPDISSTAFAVVAGLGLALYSPAGNWSEKFGPGRVLRAAQGIRCLAYIGLFGLGFTRQGIENWLVFIAFGSVVCAWSLISVSGTTLAAQLSPVG